MTTTKKDRDCLRWPAAFPGFSASAERAILSRALDDLEAAEARCAELEAQLAHVRKWAACQAGLSKIPIEEVRSMIGTLDSPLWNSRAAHAAPLAVDVECKWCREHKSCDICRDCFEYERERLSARTAPPAEMKRLRQLEVDVSVLVAESENQGEVGGFAEYMVEEIKRALVGGPYERWPKSLDAWRGER